MRIFSATFLPLLALLMPASAGEPFGLDAVLAPAGEIWVNWQNLQNEIADERRIIAHCRANPAGCAPAAARYVEIVDQAKQLEGRARLANVNRAFNLAIRWMNDTQQYGVAEVWKPPLATLASGAGDCTDFAIAKFVALGEAGVAPDDLRIVFGRIESRRQDHAVLAARDEGRWLVLDNRAMGLVSEIDFADFTPLIELDHRGVRQFVQPPQPATVARAPCARTSG